ncbi:MAG: GGDEF domain-containing protein [Chloroflexota bacterium]
MPIDQLTLLFLVVVAAVLLLLLALALALRGRRARRDPDRPARQPAADGAASASPRSLSSASALPPAVYQRLVRVASLVFIVAAMVVVVLTGTGQTTPVVIFLAISFVLILLFQDILPPSVMGKQRLTVEAAAAILFLTVLLVLTGGYASPFFFGYVLLLGAASVWASGLGPVILTLAAGAAYLVGVLIPVNPLPSSVADVGRICFNLIALALVAYVSAIVGREQRRAREEALRLSQFDSLTGLHSRDYFLSEVEQEILRASRSGRPFALLMFDLDGLKAANDRFGHASGDMLLRAVADTLRGDIRITDVAARYGGDEFVLLLPETDLNGAMLVADKVRIDIGRLALPHDGLVVRTSASIGLVTYPEDGRTSIELMRRADLAMYEAKRRGRDQVVRFAREVKHVGQGATANVGTMPDGAPNVPLTAPTVTVVPDPGTATSNAMAGEALSGVPVPAVVVAPEASVVDDRVAQARERVEVPPAWPGRAPWESSGN